MSFIEKKAIYIGKKAKLILNVDDDSEKIIVYGAINLFQIIWSIIWIMVVGFIFGAFYEAILFSTVISILRKYSGGAHASSPSRCIIIGTTICVGFGLLISRFLCDLNILNVTIFSLLAILISFIIVYKKSPVDSIKKPITNDDMKKRLRKYSIIVMSIFFLITVICLVLYRNHESKFYIEIIQCISIGALWQSVTLTNKGISILNKVDFVLKYIMEGEI